MLKNGNIKGYCNIYNMIKGFSIKQTDMIKL